MAAPRRPADPDRLLAIGLRRREIIVRLGGGAAALVTGVAAEAVAQPAAPGPVSGTASRAVATAPAPAEETAPPPKGSRDPADPDLNDPQRLWPKILTAEERATAAALCDVILPADDRSPAASQLEVHDFIDEWVGAPYPRQTEDRQIVRGGLAWINTEANRRFGKRFTELAATQKTAICDDIAWPASASPRFAAGAIFFSRMRHLTMLGFYTTPEGMKDLGYVGNVALTEWKAPPDVILRRLGLVE